MLKWLVVCLVICFAYCQIGGTRGPCSAVAIPGPFSEPVSLFGTTVGASASAINCNDDDLDNSGTAWYSITPASGDSVSITSCSSYTNFDTVVIVYSGNCEDLTCVVLGDDNDCTSNPNAGAVSFVSTGQQYFVAVVGWGGSSGQFELTFSETGANSSSSCQTAITIPGPYVTPVTIFGNTQSSTGYSQNICGLTSSSYIDWYVITPMPGSQVEVSTCNSVTDFDTRLAVLTGSCGALTCQFENDDNCTTNTYASYLTFISNQPSYYLAVFGYSTNSGTYEVRIVEYPVQSTPGGDCGTAILLPFAPGTSQLFFGSTTNNPVSSAIACSTINSPSSWYRVDVPSNYGGSITVSTCNPGTNFDTILSVYGGSCERLNCITQNDDYSCTVVGLASTVFFDIFDTLVQEPEERVLAATASASVSATNTRSSSNSKSSSISSSSTLSRSSSSSAASSRSPTPSRTRTRNAPTPTRTPSVQAGTVSFFIQVAGFSTSSGSYTLSITYS